MLDDESAGSLAAFLLDSPPPKTVSPASIGGPKGQGPEPVTANGLTDHAGGPEAPHVLDLAGNGSATGSASDDDLGLADDGTQMAEMLLGAPSLGPVEQAGGETDEEPESAVEDVGDDLAPDLFAEAAHVSDGSPLLGTQTIDLPEPPDPSLFQGAHVPVDPPARLRCSTEIILSELETTRSVGLDEAHAFTEASTMAEVHQGGLARQTVDESNRPPSLIDPIDLPELRMNDPAGSSSPFADTAVEPGPWRVRETDGTDLDRHDDLGLDLDHDLDLASSAGIGRGGNGLLLPEVNRTDPGGFDHGHGDFVPSPFDEFDDENFGHSMEFGPSYGLDDEGDFGVRFGETYHDEFEDTFDNSPFAAGPEADQPPGTRAVPRWLIPVAAALVVGVGLLLLMMLDRGSADRDQEQSLAVRTEADDGEEGGGSAGAGGSGFLDGASGATANIGDSATVPVDANTSARSARRGGSYADDVVDDDDLAGPAVGRLPTGDREVAVRTTVPVAARVTTTTRRLGGTPETSATYRPLEPREPETEVRLTADADDPVDVGSDEAAAPVTQAAVTDRSPSPTAPPTTPAPVTSAAPPPTTPAPTTPPTIRTPEPVVQPTPQPVPPTVVIETTVPAPVRGERPKPDKPDAASDGKDNPSVTAGEQRGSERAEEVRKADTKGRNQASEPMGKVAGPDRGGPR